MDFLRKYNDKRFYHKLIFLQFLNTASEPDKHDENYNQLWKVRAVSDMLNDAYAKYTI